MDFEICCVFLVAQNVEKAICISNIIIFFGSEVLGSASVLLVSEGMRLHWYRYFESWRWKFWSEKQKETCWSENQRICWSGWMDSYPNKGTVGFVTKMAPRLADSKVDLFCNHDFNQKNIFFGGCLWSWTPGSLNFVMFCFNSPMKTSHEVLQLRLSLMHPLGFITRNDGIFTGSTGWYKALAYLHFMCCTVDCWNPAPPGMHKLICCSPDFTPLSTVLKRLMVIDSVYKSEKSHEKGKNGE